MRSAHVLLVVQLLRPALLLASLASVALAGPPAEKTTIRTIVLSEHPSEPTQAIYVSGQVATVLRFEQEPLPLLVTLADGTEIPFLVSASRKEGPWTDHQVNVFRKVASDCATSWELSDLRKRERELSEENERLRREANSVDHALALLLLNGQVGKAGFRRA